jgi:uncharacterized protein YacL
MAAFALFRFLMFLLFSFRMLLLYLPTICLFKPSLSVAEGGYALLKLVILAILTTVFAVFAAQRAITMRKSICRLLRVYEEKQKLEQQESEGKSRPSEGAAPSTE